MKVLIVNTSDIVGGAARAAYRLYKALISKGICCRMLVQNKSSDDYTVLTEESKIYKYLNKLRPLIDSLMVRLYKNRTATLFSPSILPFSSMVQKINSLEPDIVHLHWICGGMMRIEDLPKIKAPIVWSLHDNWAFTGGCHIKWDCEKYRDTCGRCPRLGSNKENDLSRKVFKRKQKAFRKKKDMTIVGLSAWLNNCSKNSTLLKDKNHIQLPNPIDTDQFKPIKKEIARELWNLPKEKKLILFGANSAIKDINKGFKELSDALMSLKDDDIELVVFGSSEPETAPAFNFTIHYFGHLYDDISLIILYNAVDVVVVPSLQEAFGQTASEAMACGVPVVAFGATGLLDIVDHKINGYLAKPFDSEDLAHGIKWVLRHKDYGILCDSAIKKVRENFDSEIVAKKYVDLYEQLISHRL